MGMRGKLNQRAKYARRKEELEKYKNEPVFMKIEKVMKVMKAWYAVNGWVMVDKEAMAVLEDQRLQYKEAEDKIMKMVNDQREAAHEKVEQDFGRMHDKKRLELQLKSMQREFHTLQKLAKLKGHGKVKFKHKEPQE